MNSLRLANPKPLSEAKHPDLRGCIAAMERAAQRARELARMHQTELVMYRDGKIIFEKVS